MGRLKGKVAIVTGAASGIGFACAARYAQEGAVVVGVDAAEAPSTWQQIEKSAPAADYHVVDVRDGAALQSAADAALAAHGRIDVLLTAAGVAGGGPVHLISEEDWDRTQDINLKGTFLVLRAAGALRRGQYFDEFVELAIEPVPAAHQVANQRVRLVLREYAHAADTGIEAVRERKIDDAVLAAEEQAGLGAPVRQFVQSRSLAAREYERQRVPREQTDVTWVLLSCCIHAVTIRVSRP